MHVKKTVSIVVGLIGVILIVFGLYAMNRISSTRSNVHRMTAPMSSNPVGGAMRKAADSEMSRYDSKVRICLIAGVILLVVGGGYYYLLGKKRH